MTYDLYVGLLIIAIILTLIGIYYFGKKLEMW